MIRHGKGEYACHVFKRAAYRCPSGCYQKWGTCLRPQLTLAVLSTPILDRRGVDKRGNCPGSWESLDSLAVPGHSMG